MRFLSAFGEVAVGLMRVMQLLRSRERSFIAVDSSRVERPRGTVKVGSLRSARLTVRPPFSRATGSGADYRYTVARARAEEAQAKLQEIHRNRPRAGVEDSLVSEITRLESELRLAKDDLVRPPSFRTLERSSRAPRRLLRPADSTASLRNSRSSRRPSRGSSRKSPRRRASSKPSRGRLSACTPSSTPRRTRSLPRSAAGSRSPTSASTSRSSFVERRRTTRLDSSSILRSPSSLTSSSCSLALSRSTDPTLAGSSSTATKSKASATVSRLSKRPLRPSVRTSRACRRRRRRRRRSSSRSRARSRS